MFEDKILGHDVKKAAKTASFKLLNGMLVRTDPEFSLTSPEPDEVTVTPSYPAQAFPADGAKIVDRNADVAGVRPMSPYEYTDVTGAGTVVPHILNFETPDEGETFTPAGYQPSQPGRNPADGPKAVRLGTDWVLSKSASGAFDMLTESPSGRVSFANVILSADRTVTKARDGFAALLKHACESLIFNATNADGQTIGAVVKTDSESKMFKTVDAAVAFVADILRKQMAMPKPTDDEDEMASHMPPDQAVDDGTFDADPNLQRERAATKIQRSRRIRLQ